MVSVFTSSAVDRDVCSETLHQCYFYGKPWCVQMFCSVYLVYTRDYFQIRGTTGQVTSLSESSQVEVGDNREKW